MKSNSLVLMGAIGRPHGIRGEIGLDWHGDYIPAAGSIIYIGNDSPRPYKVTAARRHKNRLLLSLEGCADRNAADSLKGSAVYVARADLPPLEADEAFLADLLQARILLSDGTLIGHLDHLEYAGGKTIWAIKSPAGTEILFPAESDFIKAIDAPQHTITVDPPPGLLEIYDA